MNNIKEKVRELFTRLGNPEIANITEESLEYSYVVFGNKYIVEEHRKGYIVYIIFKKDDTEYEEMLGHNPNPNEVILSISKHFAEEVAKEIFEAEKEKTS